MKYFIIEITFLHHYPVYTGWLLWLSTLQESHITCPLSHNLSILSGPNSPIYPPPCTFEGAELSQRDMRNSHQLKKANLSFLYFLNCSIEIWRYYYFYQFSINSFWSYIYIFFFISVFNSPFHFSRLCFELEGRYMSHILLFLLVQFSTCYEINSGIWLRRDLLFHPMMTSKSLIPLLVILNHS